MSSQLGTLALVPQIVAAVGVPVIAAGGIADASVVARTTAITNVITGRPACGIVNRVMRELGPMNDAAPEFPLAAAALAELRAKTESLGRDDFSALWAGQNTSGCREVAAAEVTRELARGLNASSP